MVSNFVIMTKALLYAAWKIDGQLKDDIEAVIAYEVAKAMEAKPTLNPIEQAYERGEKIRRYDEKNSWIKKHSETEAIGKCGYLSSNNWEFRTHPELWEIYTEPEQVAEPTEQPKAEQPTPQFDRERFERLFLAVVTSSPKATWDSTIKATQDGLNKLDAFYASKEKGGGNE